MYKVVNYYKEDIDAIDAYKMQWLKCWVDHVVYTRNAIISILSNLQDAPAVIQRLMKNQEDIGNLFLPYYGSTDVDEIVRLLKEHITIAGNIVNTAKTGGNTTDLIKSWQENCDALVQYLISLNPYWATSSLKSLWDEHLKLTIQEVQYRISGDWENDIMTFDNILENSYKIANVLCTGIVQQNIEDFCMTM